MSAVLDGSAGLVATSLALATGVLDAEPLHVPPGWFWSEWWLKCWLDDPALFVQPVLVTVTAAVLWTMAWELARGRTPGAVISGIEVVDRDGDPPHPVRLLVRTAGIVVVVGSLGLGFWWSIVSPSRRAWHDVLSGTYVVRHADL